MEIFALVNISVPIEIIQDIGVERLDQYCSEIDKVLSVNSKNSGEISCILGNFIVERQIINGGIRFTIPSCPNSIAWTITTGFDPEPEKIVIHCTINRIDPDIELVDYIESFVSAWQTGLETHLLTKQF